MSKFLFDKDLIAAAGDKISIPAGTKVTLGNNELTATEDMVVNLRYGEDESGNQTVYYLFQNPFNIFEAQKNGITAFVNIGGSFSYTPSTGAFSWIANNFSNAVKMAFSTYTTKNKDVPPIITICQFLRGKDTALQNSLLEVGYGDYKIKLFPRGETLTANVSVGADGVLSIKSIKNASNDIAFEIKKGDETVFGSRAGIDGSMTYNPDTNELNLAKNTVITFENQRETVTLTALDDAGGTFGLVQGGLRFVPNANDGALELSFANSGRKVVLDLNGAVVLGKGGAITLEDGAALNLTWEDGAKLELISAGSTGTIALDDEKGVKITSNDENLSLNLTTAYGYSTKVSGVKGSLYYNAGKVLLEEGTKLTGSGTLGGNAVNITIEALDGDCYLDFTSSRGFVYGAGSGKLRMTYAMGDLESSFTVNKGSALVGHNVFEISEGTDIETDLKNFIPTLSLSTAEAGSYTVNGKTIETTAANLALVATDEEISFNTTGDIVKYNGMTFAGNGKVTLGKNDVILSDGVVATGFKDGNTFVMNETGSVTVDSRVFEAVDSHGDLPINVSITGAEDGFSYSLEITDNFKSYFNNANLENIGKIYTEKYVVNGDDSYSVRLSAVGIERIIGVSDGATLMGSASLGDDSVSTHCRYVTDTEGKFTIGERVYKVAGDSSVELTSAYEEDGRVYMVNDLEGSLTGDFTADTLTVNDNNLSFRIYGDKEVEVVSGGETYEVRGLDEGASLKATASGTYTVNGKSIDVQAEDVIIGAADGSAYAQMIRGTSGDDFIENHNPSVIIETYEGDDYIYNFVDSSVTAASAGCAINAGEGDDTIINDHSYNPKIYGEAGDDYIVIMRGHLNFVDAGDGNDTIIGKTNDDPALASNWAFGGNSTVYGGAGDDYIAPVYANNSYIDGGAGNDTIVANGANATINGGAGDNLITLTEDGKEGVGRVVILNGNTKVENFRLGFGEGADTVKASVPPSVDFKDGVLTFYNEESSLTISGVTSTAKVNMLYETLDGETDVLHPAVFIADDEWAKVSEDNAKYYVGATAKPNHGVDFSGIGDTLSIFMNVSDADSDAVYSLENIHSVIGGDGLTSITGTSESDTIIAGAGNTTMTGADGADTFVWNGSNNTVITDYSEEDKISIVSSFDNPTVSGADVIFKIGDNSLTLQNAADKSITVGEATIVPSLL